MEILLLLFAPVSVLIWLLIITLFLVAVWYLIGLMPAQFQQPARVVAIVIVIILVIYWLATLAPNPFG